MQFPNNINKSNLIKLGVLGVGMYLMNNRNKAKATNSNSQQIQQRQEQLNDNQENLNRQQKMTPFTFGKSLADKLLGKK